MPPSFDEKEWPVQLYRFTESGGWQKQQQQDSGTGSSVIGAAPRKNCIVIPAFRQKFSLMSNDNGGEKFCVVRRGRRIMMTSQRRIRVLVMEFASLEDCLEFSDRFLELNPSVSHHLGIATGEDRHQQASRIAAAAVTQQMQLLSQETDQEEVVSYLVRLLHDDDFLGFVHKLEAFIRSSTDGAMILSGLSNQNLEMFTAHGNEN